MVTQKISGISRPSAARQTSSSGNVDAIAASTVGMTIATAPPTISRFRPNASASAPANGPTRAMARVVTPITQVV